MARSMSEAEGGPSASGDNLTEDTFLQFVSVLSNADRELKKAQDARKAVRKQAKAAGIELGHMDAVIEMGEWDRDEVRGFFSTRLRYAKWYRLGGLVGDQGEFIFDQDQAEATDEHDAAYWAEKGFQAGVTGQTGTPPSECHPQFHQDWMHQWQAAQATLGERLKGPSTTAPAASSPAAQAVLEKARSDEATDRAAGDFEAPPAEIAKQAGRRVLREKREAAAEAA